MSRARWLPTVVAALVALTFVALACTPEQQEAVRPTVETALQTIQAPTATPTPTPAPTATPTPLPPTPTPTAAPPTATPAATATPTPVGTPTPTLTPTAIPTPTPSPTPRPTATPTPTPLPTPTPTPTPIPIAVPTGCPQRTAAGAGAPPALPTFVSGTVKIGNAQATTNTRVFAKLSHPTLGDCWTEVALTTNDNYLLIFSPPAGGGWFPAKFYVNGLQAKPSLEFTAEFALPGISVPINLTLEIAAGTTLPTPTPPPVTPGSCPARVTGAGAPPPSLPTFLSGTVTVNGSAAADGIEVLGLMHHPAIGPCWTSAVSTSAGRYLLLLSPPDSDANWFPVKFYVDGKVATSSTEVTASVYGPGRTITANLTLDTPGAATPTPTPTPSGTPTPTPIGGSGPPPPPPPY